MSMTIGNIQMGMTPEHAFSPTPSTYRTPQQVETDRRRHDRECELRRFKNGDIKYDDLVHEENRQLVDGWRDSTRRQREESEAGRVETEKVRASWSRETYFATLASMERERLIAAELQVMETERAIAKQAEDRAEACSRLGLVDSEGDQRADLLLALQVATRMKDQGMISELRSQLALLDAVESK